MGASVAVEDARQSLLANVRPGARQCIHYQDAATGDFRDVGIASNRVVFACYFNVERDRLPDRDWLAAQLTATRIDDPAPLLAGFDPATPSKGRLVCTCWEVGEREIKQAIATGTASVERLGEQLRCGTQCGSCIPELKRLLVAAECARVA